LRFFAVLFCGERFAMISIKPYKTRNMTMKNLVELVENTLKNSQNYLVKNSVESQMLKWASQGGGGRI
jgi:hypothetical protein